MRKPDALFRLDQVCCLLSAALRLLSSVPCRTVRCFPFHSEWKSPQKGKRKILQKRLTCQAELHEPPFSNTFSFERTGRNGKRVQSSCSATFRVLPLRKAPSGGNPPSSPREDRALKKKVGNSPEIRQDGTPPSADHPGCPGCCCMWTLSQGDHPRCRAATGLAVTYRSDG